MNILEESQKKYLEATHDTFTGDGSTTTFDVTNLLC